MSVTVNQETYEITVTVDFQEKGDKGDIPKHEWIGTLLSFENPDGTMDEGVDLKPTISLEIDDNMHLIATIN